MAKKKTKVKEIEKRQIFRAKTHNQKKLIQNIKTFEVSAAMGPAGVGKTFCTALVAAQMISSGDIEGLILTRANVTVGNTVGFLPGTAEEKMTPLLKPVLDCLERHLTKGKVKYMLDKNQIELLPFEYVRGRSFSNKFVIIDEAQNLTIDDVVAIVTRYESGRIVLLGDPFQNDLNDTECGLVWLERFANKHKLNMPVTLFSVDDIVRSNFVKSFISALYKDQ